jgi:multicomponent Na+:H+ antiporter subunit D
MIALLPLNHFLFAAASLAWKRGTRGLFLFSLLCDSALVGELFIRFARGEAISIVLGGWGSRMGIELAADRYSLVFCLLVLLLAGGMIAYLWKARLRPYFYMLLHLLFGSVFALLFSRDLFNIYVIMELLTLTSFLLVSYEKRSYQIWASLKYLFLASLGMGMYLFGVAILYYHTGTLNLGLLAARLTAEQGTPWLLLASSLLVTGIAIKSGIFIFSLWLPAAHASASPAISALLSGLVIKMGVVVLLRLSTLVDLSLPLLVLGSLTGILGAIYAIFTYDLKRMLAFSTLSQIGYLLLGIGIGSPITTTGSVTYAVGHGLFKGLLFLAAGAAVEATGRRDIPGLIAKQGQIPLATRVGLLVGTMGIMGIPPFAGFCGKSLLSNGTESSVIQTILLLLSIGTVISFAKLIPLFRFERGPSSPWPRIAAYVILGLPMVLFLPLTRLFLPIELWKETFTVFHALESLLVVGAGYLIYRALPKRPLPLPQRIFRLEEGILVILAGFFLVFLLSLFG